MTLRSLREMWRASSGLHPSPMAKGPSSGFSRLTRTPLGRSGLSLFSDADDTSDRSGCGNRAAISSRRPRVWESGGSSDRSGGLWTRRAGAARSAKRNPWAIHGVSMPEQTGRRDRLSPDSDITWFRENYFWMLGCLVSALRIQYSPLSSQPKTNK